MNLLNAFFTLVCFATFSQNTTTIINIDSSNTFICYYQDDFLDEQKNVLGKGYSSTFDFKLTYPTLINLSVYGKRSPFLIFPKDSVCFKRNINTLQFESTNKPDSLFHVLTKLEYTVGLEIAYHSNYQISNPSISDIDTLKATIFKKLNKQLDLVNKYYSKEDSIKWSFTTHELKSFALIELMQPYFSIGIKPRDFPTWYADSIIAFRQNIESQWSGVGGTEHKTSIVLFNQFLCRDSLGSKNDFQVLINSAVRNFKNEQLNFLFAYLLKKYKPLNPLNYYDNVGLFYQLCTNELYLKYVKDKIDDSNFKFPDKILKTTLLSKEGGKIKWEDLLAQNIGKLIYIDLWASWCPPCIGEMPCMDKLNKNVAIISISIDKAKKQWFKTLKKYKFDTNEHGHYWIGDDEKFVQFLLTRRENEFTPLWIPKYILIDQKGNIITSKAARPCTDEINRQFILFSNN